MITSGYVNLNMSGSGRGQTIGANAMHDEVVVGGDLSQAQPSEPCPCVTGDTTVHTVAPIYLHVYLGPWQISRQVRCTTGKQLLTSVSRSICLCCAPNIPDNNTLAIEPVHHLPTQHRYCYTARYTPRPRNSSIIVMSQ